MKDPRRVVGREDDIRVDALLVQESVSSSAPLCVTYQIQNLSPLTVAVADRVTSAEYDADAGTISLAIGTEAPADGVMPHLVAIAPGTTRTLQAHGLARVSVVPSGSRYVMTPRAVEIHVNVIRDITPFLDLFNRQLDHQTADAGEPMSDAQFERWMQLNTAIFLNSVPVRWNPRGATPTLSAEQSGFGRRF